MNKKRLESLCVILIIIAFSVIGYYTYRSYDEKKDSDDSDIEMNNFYDVDYLFNNSYIDTPKTIEDFSSEKGKLYIYLDASNTMHIKYTNNKKYSKVINGLPENKVTVYYNNISDSYYEFIAKTDTNNVYYLYTNINNSQDDNFSYIGDNIEKIYIPLYDKNGIYVNEKDEFATKYILYDSEGNFKYIDINSRKKYVLKSQLNEKRPYFDYICASENSYICNKLMIYITFNNELIYKSNKLTDENGKIIYATDIFASFEITSKNKIDINKINKKNFEKYKYLFSTYIIDNNQILYRLDISDKKEELIKINTDSNKIKEYMYKANNKLTIIFENGTEKVIKADKNKILTTSTIYDKKQSNSEKVSVQP